MTDKLTRTPFILRNPSTLVVLAVLAVLTVAVTLLSQAYGSGVIATSTVKVLGKTLCLALAAVAMDLVWGYLGILSLGQMAFFALGGYLIGQWLMYARTEAIVAAALAGNPIPPTPAELQEGVANQIFGVVGSADLPLVWSFAHSLPVQLLLVVAVPGLLALVFGWLAFRSRVNGVYLSILTQAMTLALALWLFQNDSGFRGNNGLSGLQNIPGLETVDQATLSVWFLWASALALGLAYVLAAWLVSGKFGSVILAPNKLDNPDFPKAEVRTPVLLACDAGEEAKYMEERFGPISAALPAAPKREEKSLHGSWLNCTPNSGPLSSPTVVGAGGKCS